MIIYFHLLFFFICGVRRPCRLQPLTLPPRPHGGPWAQPCTLPAGSGTHQRGGRGHRRSFFIRMDLIYVTYKKLKNNNLLLYTKQNMKQKKLKENLLILIYIYFHLICVEILTTIALPPSLLYYIFSIIIISLFLFLSYPFNATTFLMTSSFCFHLYHHKF